MKIALEGMKNDDNVLDIHRCSVCNKIKDHRTMKICSRMHESYLKCANECQCDGWQKRCSKHNHNNTIELRSYLGVGTDIIGGYAPILEGESDGLHTVTIIPIMDKGDSLSFIYTKGLHERYSGCPELLAVDVPADFLRNVMEFIRVVALNIGPEFSKNPDALAHGYKLEIDNIWAIICRPQTELQRYYLNRSMGACHRDADVILVMPFENNWNDTSIVFPSVLNYNPYRAECLLDKWRYFRETYLPSPPALEPQSPPSTILECKILSFGNIVDTITASERKVMTYNEKYDSNENALNSYVKDVANNIRRAKKLYNNGKKVAAGRYITTY